MRLGRRLRASAPRDASSLLEWPTRRSSPPRRRAAGGCARVPRPRSRCGRSRCGPTGRRSPPLDAADATASAASAASAASPSAGRARGACEARGPSDAAGTAQPSTPKLDLPTKLSGKSSARVAVAKTDTTAPAPAAETRQRAGSARREGRESRAEAPRLRKSPEAEPTPPQAPSTRPPRRRPAAGPSSSPRRARRPRPRAIAAQAQRASTALRSTGPRSASTRRS